jgi:hypothetical protein
MDLIDLDKKCTKMLENDGVEPSEFREEDEIEKIRKDRERQMQEAANAKAAAESAA